MGAAHSQRREEGDMRRGEAERDGGERDGGRGGVERDGEGERVLRWRERRRGWQSEK
jgi:hypothetical protein